MQESRWSVAVLCAGLACAVAAPQTAVAADGTVEAYSSWQARGQVFPTGTDEATFVGVLSGVLIVKGEDGTIDSGQIMCPGSVVINTADGSQIGHGKCIILTPDSERIYGEFSCYGQYGQDCDGEFSLTGGTGDKTGISGGGPIQLRNIATNLAESGNGNVVDQAVAGIAVWPKLIYTLP